MQFIIELKQSYFHFDQEIALSLCIINSNKDIQLPYDFRYSNLLLLKINEINTNNVFEIHGYHAQWRNTPAGDVPPSRTTKDFFTLDAKKQFSWDIDLLQYTDPLPTGKYQLQAEIYNADKTLLMSSNQIEFEVLSKTPWVSLDAIRYDGDMGSCRLFISQAYKNHIQVHSALNTSPQNYFQSYSIEHKSLFNKIRPLIVEANIDKGEISNRFNQIVWQDNTLLFSHSWHTIKESMYESETLSINTAGEAKIVGRPFLNGNKHLSVFFIKEQMGKYKITLDSFGEHLNFLNSQDIIELKEKPYEIETATNFNGDIEVLVLESQKFPLTHFRLNEDTTSYKTIDLPESELLKPEDTILFTNINAKYHQHPYKSITAVLLDNESKTKLTTVSIDTTGDDQDIKLIRQYQLPKMITDEIEQLVFAQSIITNLGDTDSVDELEYEIVTVIGFKDNIYKLNTDGSTEEVPTSVNAEISDATLFQDRFDSIYIVIPEKDGGYKTELLIENSSQFP